MISRGDLKNLTLYLKPYRYRCISKGINPISSVEKENNDNIDLVEFDMKGNLYNDYINDEVDCLQRIWFEIVGVINSEKKEHIGYITGYYIDLNHIQLHKFDEWHLEKFSEYPANSPLTMELWNYLKYDGLDGFEPNYYFINSITIDKHYRVPELETAAVKLIKNALWEIYRQEVNTLIYSIGRTESFDDTIGDEMDDSELRAHEKNILEIGFHTIFNDMNEKVYLIHTGDEFD